MSQRPRCIAIALPLLAPALAACSSVRSGSGSGAHATCSGDGNACDDGDPCTEGETCRGGGCSGGRAVDCDDGLWCTGHETCRANLGCVHEDAPDCADDVACTEDRCDEILLRCIHKPVAATCGEGAWCNPFAGCEPIAPCTSDGDCIDQSLCNGQEWCNAGLCQPGPSLVCSDGRTCTDDACDETTGGCLFTPRHDVCDDGIFCNGTESCDPLQPDANASSGCVSKPLACEPDECRIGAHCSEAQAACVWEIQDGDSDGAGNAACGGTDCDDADAALRPGAADTCNHRDDDCDRTADEGIAYAILARTPFPSDQQDGLGFSEEGFAVVSAPYPEWTQQVVLFDADGQAQGSPIALDASEFRQYDGATAVRLPSGRWAVVTAAVQTLYWIDFDPASGAQSGYREIATLPAQASAIEATLGPDRFAVAVSMPEAPPKLFVLSHAGAVLGDYAVAAALTGTRAGVAFSGNSYLVTYEGAGAIEAVTLTPSAEPQHAPLRIGTGGHPDAAWTGDSWVVTVAVDSQVEAVRLDGEASTASVPVVVQSAIAQLTQVRVAAGLEGGIAVAWNEEQQTVFQRLDASLRPTGALIGNMGGAIGGDTFVDFAAVDGRFGLMFMTNCAGCNDARGITFVVFGCGS